MFSISQIYTVIIVGVVLLMVGIAFTQYSKNKESECQASIKEAVTEAVLKERKYYEKLNQTSDTLNNFDNESLDEWLRNHGSFRPKD